MIVIGAGVGLLRGAPAVAAEKQLAPAGDRGALSAYGGWVLWSEQVAHADERGQRWALVAWHHGTTRRLSVRTRSVPFDVDVGPDRSGRPVALYSRCHTDPFWPPRYGPFGPPLPPGDASFPITFANGLPDWSRGSGCRIVQLDMTSGTVRAVKLPRPRRASDTTPSIWFGRIAFARRTPHHDVSQVLLWWPSRHRLIRLRHGAVPHSCPYRNCSHARYSGEVQQLDLGAKLATFVWKVEAPAVVGGERGWELRADRLADNTTVRADGGSESGNCVVPHSPTASGNSVWFIRDHICDQRNTSISLTDARSLKTSEAEPPAGTVWWRMARDGLKTYLIRGPNPAAGGTPPNSYYGFSSPCRSSADPCSVTVETSLTLRPTTRPPGSPFYP